MFLAARASLALFLFCSLAAFANDIYRHRMADGRILFSDSPTPPQGSVESARVGGAGRLIALAPGTPQHGVPRERAESAVRQAEAELLEAYHRLTFGVKPREDEIDWGAIDTSAPAPRGKARRLPTTAGYHTRIDTLKADITKAQERLDAARERYYASN